MSLCLKVKVHNFGLFFVNSIVVGLLFLLFFVVIKNQIAANYMQQFLNEYKDLCKNGFQYNERSYTVTLRYFCCNVPARQFLKSIKGHTGHNACKRCTVEGIYHESCF